MKTLLYQHLPFPSSYETVGWLTVRDDRAEHDRGWAGPTLCHVLHPEWVAQALQPQVRNSLGHVSNLARDVLVPGTNKLMVQADDKEGRRPLAHEQRELLPIRELKVGRGKDRYDTRDIPHLARYRIQRLKDHVLRIALLLH